MSAATSLSACSRRTFLHQTAVGVLGGTLAATLGPARMVHAAGSDVLKVGLIGCGGRGRGAAVNAMNADKNVQLTALADLFPDQIEAARPGLQAEIGDQYQVPEDQCFAGFDAAKQLIATDVDVVLLAETPHYRPAHLQAAVEAGKHIFCEKPIAVDPVGVRSVLATCEAAEKKGLNIVSGLCWRYDLRVRETIDRIRNGAIGDIVAIQENYLTSTLWLRERQPSWSEMEYQNRNWLYYTWLSGDHITEQFIHSLDKALWLMGDEPPQRCFGLGGRQVRTLPEFGHIYDHFSVCYEWANGVKAFAYTRQMANCHNDVDDYVLGTQGTAQILARGVKGVINGKVVNQGADPPGMYDYEHAELFRAIRSGKPINNGRYMSLSTMMAIAGREACYTGQMIDFEEALRADMRLGPEKYEWGDVPVDAIALPGVTAFPRA
ncbi:MAG: Gfo/Idh/MocA family oxidoreductase [Pirellulaceae bacterium]|jgi:predicted dehydrogenase|nr:Gfo/Idh/MocA family oxidoreductase [Pirellulaceae bacterium]